MYWFYSHSWYRVTTETKQTEMKVFEGSFVELIKFTSKQPENWCILYCREITKEEYYELDKVL